MKVDEELERLPDERGDPYQRDDRRQAFAAFPTTDRRLLHTNRRGKLCLCLTLAEALACKQPVVGLFSRGGMGMHVRPGTMILTLRPAEQSFRVLDQVSPEDESQ